MNQNFLYMYKQIAGRSAREAALERKWTPILDFIAGLLDGKHVVVLHALQDSIEREMDPGDWCEWVKPARQTWELVQAEFSGLSVDLRMRLDEFSQNWKSRLNQAALLPYLKSNGWVQEVEGAFRMSGKGTRNEAKIFYQQSLQDMIVEGVRIVALFEGVLLRLQENISQKWHGEAVHNNTSRLLPLFEAGLRTREMELFKNIRARLPDYFLELFIRRVNKWDKRIYSTQSELFKNMVWPWYNSVRHESGFEGFNLFFVNFIWNITQNIFGLYHRKWRLFLRGLEVPELKVSSLPAG